MPQLDQFTYFTQFAWLCVFFLSIYILLYNDGLPKVSRILKLRAMLVKKQDDNAHFSETQTEQDTVIKESFNACASYLSGSVSGASEWCNQMVANLNANQLNTLNKTYVRCLGEMSVSQLIKRNTLDKFIAFATDAIVKAPVDVNRIFVLRMQKKILVKNTSKKKRSQNA